jgi:methionyl-tRNA synthetase
LVATYGNLVNRVLSFTFRNFDGKVPGVQSLDEVDEGLLRTARETMDSVDDSLYNCRFKSAVTQAFGLAQEANRYLDTKAPWKSIKEDRDLAGSSLTVAMQAINCLKTILYPFMPFSSQKVHEFLGFEGPVEEGAWDYQSLVDGIKTGADLRQPSPLYTKLDPELIEEEVQKLGIGASE